MEPENEFEKRLVNELLSRLRSESCDTHHRDYEVISSKLADVRIDKVAAYGTSRYEDNDEEFDLWMCFCDVHRKYIRLKTLTKLVRAGHKEALPALVDAYRDIANYGMMGVQILEKYYGKQNTEIGHQS